jgi:tRNA threonylcarbamoyladenosine modification (KEOPS) complex Cgi121 subunit
MLELIEFAGSGVYVSALMLPRVPADWPELLASWKGQEAQVCIQMVDAATIAGMGHVLFLVFNAVSAFRYGYNKLKRLEAELLLVLSGTDRFGRAVEMVGAKVGRPGVAIIVAEERSACAHSTERIAACMRGVDVLPYTTGEAVRGVAKALGLSAGELRAMGDDIEASLYSVIERGALIYC